MNDDRKKELMAIFDFNRERTPEEKEWIALLDEYKKRFGEQFGYPWGAPVNKNKFPTDEELLKYCLKKNKSLKELYPTWFNRDYKKKNSKHDLYLE